MNESEASAIASMAEVIESLFVMNSALSAREDCTVELATNTALEIRLDEGLVEISARTISQIDNVVLSAHDSARGARLRRP